MTWLDAHRAAEDGDRVVIIDLNSENSEITARGTLDKRDDGLWFTPDEGEPCRLESVSNWLEWEAFAA